MSEPTSPERLRLRLADLVEADGAAHQRLPAERELASEYGVSRLTVRRALDQLERQGKVYRVQGSGTFIAPTRVSKALELTSFSEDMRMRGLRPGSREQSMDYDRAAHRCFALRLRPESKVLRISRVRTADDIPMCLETIFVPAGVVPPNFILEPGCSLYEELERQAGLRPAWAEQTVQATVIQADEAVRLEVPPFTPALHVERTVFDISGTVMEHASSIYRGDRYRYDLVIRRDDGGSPA